MRQRDYRSRKYRCTVSGLFPERGAISKHPPYNRRVPGSRKWRMILTAQQVIADRAGKSGTIEEIYHE